uniref:Neurexin/syndecan/glycophorin C domain-containing protein n=1 Tax=Kryptolebias marmoratus TaxID=37003 RepID=A0A3Q3H202_KRYMA
LIVSFAGPPCENQMSLFVVNVNVLCLAGVIAVVIFVIATVLAVTARFLYRRKETYQNQDAKGVKQEDRQDFSYNNQPDSQNVSGENPKDFFM